MNERENIKGFLLDHPFISEQFADELLDAYRNKLLVESGTKIRIEADQYSEDLDRRHDGMCEATDFTDPGQE